jgi:hypothetical protein
VSLSECFERVERVLKTFEHKYISTRNKSILFKKVIYDNKDAFLIFYPVYFIKYKYKNTNYNISVDGYNGEILYGRFPKNDDFKIVIILILCSIFALIFSLAIPNFSNIIVMLKTLAKADETTFSYIILIIIGFILLLGFLVKVLGSLLGSSNEFTIKGGQMTPEIFKSI